MHYITFLLLFPLLFKWENTQCSRVQQYLLHSNSHICIHCIYLHSCHLFQWEHCIVCWMEIKDKKIIKTLCQEIKTVIQGSIFQGDCLWLYRSSCLTSLNFALQNICYGKNVFQLCTRRERNANSGIAHSHTCMDTPQI